MTMEQQDTENSYLLARSQIMVSLYNCAADLHRENMNIQADSVCRDADKVRKALMHRLGLVDNDN